MVSTVKHIFVDLPSTGVPVSNMKVSTPTSSAQLHLQPVVAELWLSIVCRKTCIRPSESLSRVREVYSVQGPVLSELSLSWYLSQTAAKPATDRQDGSYDIHFMAKEVRQARTLKQTSGSPCHFWLGPVSVGLFAKHNLSISAEYFSELGACTRTGSNGTCWSACTQ